MSALSDEYDEHVHPASRIANVRRRVSRARAFPVNTCPASRHVHLMADSLVTYGQYYMLAEEPAHCAASLYSVLESLWKARTELARLKASRPSQSGPREGGSSAAEPQQNPTPHITKERS